MWVCLFSSELVFVVLVNQVLILAILCVSTQHHSHVLTTQPYARTRGRFFRLKPHYLQRVWLSKVHVYGHVLISTCENTQNVGVLACSHRKIVWFWYSEITSEAKCCHNLDSSPICSYTTDDRCHLKRMNLWTSQHFFHTLEGEMQWEC